MLERSTGTTRDAGGASARDRQADARPGTPPPSAKKGTGLIVIGAPGDVPRALAHPVVASGKLSLAATIAVEIGDEGPRAIDGLSTILRTSQANTILIAGSIGAPAMRQVADLATLYHCDLLAVMPTDVLAEHDPVVVWSGDYPLVQLSRARQLRFQAAMKRALDVAAAALGIAVCAPLMTLLMLAIRLESPGSPVFRHERVGYRGRRFLCLKLRTMRVDAQDQLRADPAMYEEYRRHHFKIPDDRDPRVTKLGRLLRKASLDELPQLWNVLTGEMSLVGPRPVIEEELELYGNNKDVVLSVRPGMTGAWAVNGRQNLGYPQRCETELGYVRDWTIARDVEILLRTVGTVVGVPHRVSDSAEPSE